jgi:glycosyltransferase involved in cell wall biosynthesis
VRNGREPAVSAVICTYNRYDHLENAVASLLSQTLAAEDLEILVIDNSPDGPTRKAAVAKYSQMDRIDYITVDRAGLANARNVAAREANGRTLAFLDDDAIADPVWAEALLDAFTNNGPDAKIAGGPVEPMYEIAPPQWLDDELAGHLTRIDWGAEPRFLRSREWLAGANIAYLRQAYLDAGGCDVNLGRIGAGASLLSNEETELSERIKRSGGRIFYTPRARVKHFVPASRIDQGWFRRRAMWQAISDQLVKDITPEETANLRSDILGYIASVPPELRSLRAFFYEVRTPNEFRRQLSNIYNFYRLTTARGDLFPSEALG